MGQLCCKCTGEQEEGEAVGNEQLGCTEGPLLAAAIPPAVESPVAEPFVQEISEEESPGSRPGAESSEAAFSTTRIPKVVPPEADSPEAAPLVAEPPVEATFLAGTEVVPPVVEPPALKPSAVELLVPQDTPALPSSQQEDDRGGSSRTSHLEPGTPVPTASITPAGGNFLDFPILQDLETIMYVQKSKVSGLNNFLVVQ